jgi:hypothetical protein
MKTYTAIATLIAILGLGGSGYLFVQQGSMRQEIATLKASSDILAKDKALADQQLNQMKATVQTIQKSANTLNLILNAFMYAGDLKALAVGTKEATNVETAIGTLDNSQDRMIVEQGWADFKTSRRFNPLFGILRNLASGISRNIDNLKAPENPGENALQPVR